MSLILSCLVVTALQDHKQPEIIYHDPQNRFIVVDDPLTTVTRGTLIPVHDIQVDPPEVGSTRLTGVFYLGGKWQRWGLHKPKIFVSTAHLNDPKPGGNFEPAASWKAAGTIGDPPYTFNERQGSKIPFVLNVGTTNLWIAVQLRGDSPFAAEDEISFAASIYPNKKHFEKFVEKLYEDRRVATSKSSTMEIKANAIVPISWMARFVSAESLGLEPTPIYTNQVVNLDSALMRRLRYPTPSPQLGDQWVPFQGRHSVAAQASENGNGHRVVFLPDEPKHYLIAAVHPTGVGNKGTVEWSGVIRPPE